jgi:hypothetical protein
MIECKKCEFVGNHKGNEEIKVFKHYKQKHDCNFEKFCINKKIRQNF